MTGSVVCVRHLPLLVYHMWTVTRRLPKPEVYAFATMRLSADWGCFGLVPSLPYGLKDVHDDRGPYQYCTVCTAGVKNAEPAASGFDFCIPACPTKFTAIRIRTQTCILLRKTFILHKAIADALVLCLVRACLAYLEHIETHLALYILAELSMHSTQSEVSGP
jgi:hypothetical protein